MQKKMKGETGANKQKTKLKKKQRKQPQKT